VTIAQEAVNALVKGQTPKLLVTASKWLGRSLHEYKRPEAFKITRTNFDRVTIKVQVLCKVAVWTEFDPSSLHSVLGNRQVEEPNEQSPLRLRGFDVETMFEGLFSHSRECIFRVMHSCFPALRFNDIQMQGTPTNPGMGDITDEAAEIDSLPVYIKTSKRRFSKPELGKRLQF